MQFGLLLGLVMVCVSATVTADTAHHQDKNYREFTAHKHGVAELNWAMEGQEITMSLSSPIMNLLGFEHRPQNQHENQQLMMLLTTLADSDKVITFTGGQCRLSSVNIVNPFAAKVSDDKEQHTFLEAGEHEHNDMTVEYNFLCQQPLQLETLTIKLFDTFSGFEFVRAQWIVNGTLGGATFNPDNYLLKVR